MHSLLFLYLIFSQLILENNAKKVSENLIYIQNNKCLELCDTKGGTCTTDQICKCKRNYATIPSENFKFCNYQRKNKLISAFLELFIGFGTGHFYSGRKINGCFKFIITTFSCCCSLCMIVLGSKFDTETNDQNQTTLKIAVILSMVCFLVFIFWQLCDCVLFLCNAYLDGNGIELY